jgi:hypothetical protein
VSEITDKPDYKEALAGAIDASNVYFGILALKGRIALLESAVAWALGENGEFRERREGEGAYWWRKELRERASIGRESSNESSNGKVK